LAWHACIVATLPSAPDTDDCCEISWSDQFGNNPPFSLIHPTFFAAAIGLFVGICRVELLQWLKQDSRVALTAALWLAGLLILGTIVVLGDSINRNVIVHR
jgi:hypothetical protein